MKFANFKIRTKILILSIIILAFTLFIGVYNIIGIKRTDNNYTLFMQDSLYCIDLLDTAKNSLNESRMQIRDYVRYIYTNNTQGITKADEQLKISNPALDKAMNDYKTFLVENYPDDVDQINKVSALILKINNEFREYCKQMYALALEGKGEEANTLLQETILPVSEDIKASLYGMYDWEIEYAYDVMKTNGSITTRTTIISIIVLVISMLCGFIAALIIARSIASAIIKTVNNIDKMSQGDFAISLDVNRKDEVGEMSRSLANMKDIINSLINGVQTMIDKFNKGTLDSKIDSSVYKGSYKVLSENINGLIDDTTKETSMLLDCMREFGIGNFNSDIPKLPGNKAAMNETIDNIRANLKSVGKDISNLVQEASKGELSQRVDINKYNGDWAVIMSELNGLMEAIVLPINEASEVLLEVSAGKFDRKMVGNYKGEFLTIKSSINNTVTNIASYIDEISSILEALADKDFNQAIEREYLGKFSNIKISLNNIIDTLNNVISDIASAADQVAAGSKQISESSMTLADGASEQASAIEELNATILTINESTTQNAGDAKEAESLSDRSKNNAVRGDKDMGHMLSSMNLINESSNSISKIIKVIEDIAFQTNLLALNAAVEAARAGEHGKGFAVVAEEVRSLAARSQDAAKETTGLIEASITRVNEGTETAKQTAGALQTILNDVSNVAVIITGIATASEEQALAISQITEGISQIADVIQNNSATSEQTAAAAQQLSSQSELLQSMVKAFKIKRKTR